MKKRAHTHTHSWLIFYMHDGACPTRSKFKVTIVGEKSNVAVDTNFVCVLAVTHIRCVPSPPESLLKSGSDPSDHMTADKGSVPLPDATFGRVVRADGDGDLRKIPPALGDMCVGPAPTAQAWGGGTGGSFNRHFRNGGPARAAALLGSLARRHHASHVVCAACHACKTTPMLRTARVCAKRTGTMILSRTV